MTSLDRGRSKQLQEGRGVPLLVNGPARKKRSLLGILGGCLLGAREISR
jgi:hypothetical protein